MGLAQVIAGIGWEPEIRGALSVLVGVLVLMGSVYLLLATNVANRLGFLLALTGFFGWMFLMAGTWWIYGLGWAGEPPAWQVEEINTGRLDQSILDEAHRLQGVELPDFAMLDGLPSDEFAQVAADLKPELGGWALLSAADPTRGEAQSVVDEVLTGDAYPSFTGSDDYVVTYGMEIGGKPTRQSDSVFDRVANQVTNTFQFTHPPHYAIIQVVPGAPETQPELGEAPPPTVVVEGTDVVSVILVRDIGDRRLPAAVTTIVSAVIFLTLCYMLHVRDKTLEANRSAPLPEPSGGEQPVKAGV